MARVEQAHQELKDYFAKVDTKQSSATDTSTNSTTDGQNYSNQDIISSQGKPPTGKPRLQ